MQISVVDIFFLLQKIEELEQENYKLMNENMKAKEKLVSLGGQVLYIFMTYN
jgi:hypothetical protein